MQLQLAQKKKVKLKIGVSGASGFGKTYSSLLLAYGITNDWSKIAVIDTENGSASLYSDLGPYYTIPLGPAFTPEKYIQAIQTCVKGGIEVAIIDSTSHEWEGEGGCLDIQTQLGGRYQDWKTVTPRHNKFIQSILQAPIHIITTTRRKQDYEMSNNGGRTTVTKVGTKEITREGFEYELTLNFELINDQHLVKASKDRTGLFDKKPEFIITSETGKQLLDWANSGVDELPFIISALKAVENRAELETLYMNNQHLANVPEFVAVLKEMGQKYPKIEE
jgi:hypothetical protein